jgi:hypothetical protein
MTRRRNKANSKALDIVEGVVQTVDFIIAAVAGTGIYLPYLKAASENTFNPGL